MTDDRTILDETADAYAGLRSDPERWQEELDERAEWDTTLADGLEDEDMATTRDGDVLTEAQLDYYQKHAEQSVMIGTGFTLEIIASHRALQQQLDAAEQRAERYREALEAARHSLTTLHGLWATDEDPSVSRYEEAVECGLDNHAILDGIVERSWHLDESVVLEQIDAALTEQERDDA